MIMSYDVLHGASVIGILNTKPYGTQKFNHACHKYYSYIVASYTIFLLNQAKLCACMHESYIVQAISTDAELRMDI